RNERRMMIAADGAVIENEVEQIGHLLEVRRHVWIVAPQMHVVEYDVHNAFHLPARGPQLTSGACRLRSADEERSPHHERRCDPKNSSQWVHSLSPVIIDLCVCGRCPTTDPKGAIFAP